jgi:hypothetical protein
MRTLIFLVIVLALAAPERPSAWWLTAHTVINRTAVATLPEEVPDFLRRQIDWIGARSIAPDSWRDATEPSLKAIEDPNHTWYLEVIPPMAQLPRSRNDFILMARDVRATGTLPYAMIENYERLKVAFRTWRGLRARHENTTFIEMDAAFYVGWLGHYVGDGAMPLHTSIHHNGWVGENPKNYTRDPDIHGRFEGEFVDLIELTGGDITGRVPAAQPLADPLAAFLSYLDRSHTRVEQVYALDQTGAYEDAGNAEARELVYACTTEAAAMLRDLIYSAWRASAL